MRGRLTVAVLLAAAALPSCGGSPVGPPSPSGTRTVIQTNNFTDIAEGGVFRLEVDLIPIGTVDTTVDWSVGPNVSVYVTTPSCVNGRDAIAGVCSRVAFANGAAKPKKVTFDNPRVETYYYHIHNEGPGRLTGTMETALTR